MTAAVVFPFAVADGLSPVVGAAPYEVLARQLPRLLVARLNDGGDRGIRFFPFLGPIDGQRSFLRLRELFDPRALAQIHKQDTRFLCDGLFQANGLHVRVMDAVTHEVVLALDLPFDPLRPLEAVARLEYELLGALGWSGRPHAPLALSGEALGWFLVLKDTVLRREANLVDPATDPLRPARRCVELAGDDVDVQDAVLDLCAHTLRRGERRTEVAEVVQALAPRVTRPVAAIERAAAIAVAAGADVVAAEALLRAAHAAPERADLVERAAAQLFRLGRLDEVRDLVARARARGAVSSNALAQLAAAHDRSGDTNARDGLVEELRVLPDLPVPVARLVVSFLLEQERATAAMEVLDRALLVEPGNAMLHFEAGRACLLLDDGDRAASALRRAIELGLPVTVAGQAHRFLRLSVVPGLWAGTQTVENAIVAGDPAGALAALHRMVRRTGPVAEAWVLLGIVRSRLAQGRRAERAFRRALHLDPQNAEAHNRLGVVLLSRGEVEAGHHHLERAHQLAPLDSGPLLHLAQACALLGRRAEAERHVIAAERAGAAPTLVEAVRRGFLQARD